MDRRRAFITTASVIGAPLTSALWLGSAHAQARAAAADITPYLKVPIVAGDETVVRVYFAPGCTYSRDYLQFFKNLQRTLPERKTFLWAPLANATDGLSYVIAFAAVQRWMPTHVANWVEASLIGAQDHQLSVRSWAGLDKIGRAAQLPQSVVGLVARRGDELRQDVKRLLLAQQGLGVTNTPSVAIAGTYIVTPEFAHGDPAVFSQLVNGVISMTY
jgi:hypothetical protein